MTQEIIEMAKPYEWLGAEGWTFNHYWQLEAFANLIAAKERERVIATLKELDTVCNEDGGYDEPQRQDCIWAIEEMSEA